MPVTIVLPQGPQGATYNHLVSVTAPEWLWNETRVCYKSFQFNMTTEKSEKPNLHLYLVLMPQVLVDAGCPQGSASTCCTFQTIIYPKE